MTNLCPSVMRQVDIGGITADKGRNVMEYIFNPKSPADRVSNGVKFLDENGPKNWREMIDLDKLDIQDGMYCILGQVFADKVGTRVGAGVGTCECCTYVNGYDYGYDLFYGVNPRPNHLSDLGFVFSSDKAEWVKVLTV